MLYWGAWACFMTDPLKGKWKKMLAVMRTKTSVCNIQFCLNPFKDKISCSVCCTTVLPFLNFFSCSDRHLMKITCGIVTLCDLQKILLKKQFPAGGNTVQCLNHLLTTSHLLDRNVNMITALAAETEVLNKSLQLLFFWFREGDLLIGTAWRK